MVVIPLSILLSYAEGFTNAHIAFFLHLRNGYYSPRFTKRKLRLGEVVKW